ncbi:hypothetical protein AVEN_206954-1 [Araneus ventricosus]|uniref:Uncharacterized protein n=1 Tax=Araneus ventricosus TaxID=182803 RepID=A0A4Y2L8J8_ARAVE|nr:hypothetical protein AVEN_206954-1 [Araneus ventricosus]
MSGKVGGESGVFKLKHWLSWGVVGSGVGHAPAIPVHNENARLCAAASALCHGQGHSHAQACDKASRVKWDGDNGEWKAGVIKVVLTIK